MGVLDGKVAIVTGGARGVGRGISLAFAKEGARVWATDINEATLPSLAQEQETIETRRLDITDDATIQAVMKQASDQIDRELQTLCEGSGNSPESSASTPVRASSASESSTIVSLCGFHRRGRPRALDT